jgi:hypothetical protein
MPSPEAFIGLSEHQYLNGHQITVQVEKETEQVHRPASDTSRHEATHAVVAKLTGTSVKVATIEPTGTSLGHVELDRPNAIAAAAPHADGCSGTSHDVHIIALMGQDVQSASKVATGIVGNSRKEIAAVASLLDKKRTIGDYYIEEAMASVGRKEQEGEKVTVSIKAPDGKEKILKDVSSRDGQVMVPGEWVALTAA